eukprot:scaffold74749_cov35-Cyclotella_meneghiniana.AAC.5
MDSLLHSSSPTSHDDDDEDLITPYDIFAEELEMQTEQETAQDDTTMDDAESTAESDDIKMTRQELADDIA